MGLLSTALSGVFGASSAKSAQKYNAQEAQKNRDFAQEFYQNRYQWQAEDMRAAGLNPILSASQGAGNVPATGAASSSESAAGDAAALSNAYTAKKQAEDQAKINAATIRKLDSETELNNQQSEAGYQYAMADAKRQEVETQKSLADKYAAESYDLRERLKMDKNNEQLQNQLTLSQIREYNARSKMQELQSVPAEAIAKAVQEDNNIATAHYDREGRRGKFQDMETVAKDVYHAGKSFFSKLNNFFLTGEWKKDEK